MNYPPGTILYFTSFKFKNGGSATRPAEKAKYFIVLRNMDGELVVACLPSSVDRIPEDLDQTHGCKQFTNGGFTAYLFEAERNITTNSWGFPLTTYVYPFGVETYDKKVLSQQNPRFGADYQLMGRLVEPEFVGLVDCLRTSSDIKNKMRRALEGATYGPPDVTPSVAFEPSVS
jgi:hypothetical protein